MVATVALGMTGKVGTGGGVKTSRLIVSCIVYCGLLSFVISFTVPVLGGLVASAGGCGRVCAGWLWALPQAVPLGRPRCAKRVMGRVDHSGDYVVLPDCNFDAEVSEFGCPPT